MGYGFALDESLLNPFVFEIVQSINLIQTIDSIQADTFKSLTSLSRIYISAYNMRSFFHKIGIEWTLVLQNFSTVEFSDDVTYITFIYVPYSFPNEDLCLFSDWPHQKMIVPTFYEKI